MSKENKEDINKEESLLGDVPDGMVLAENSRESIYCMCIVGQIEGHYLAGDNQKSTKYEHILPRLVSLEEDEHTAMEPIDPNEKVVYESKKDLMEAHPQIDCHHS